MLTCVEEGCCGALSCSVAVQLLDVGEDLFASESFPSSVIRCDCWCINGHVDSIPLETILSNLRASPKPQPGAMNTIAVVPAPRITLSDIRSMVYHVMSALSDRQRARLLILQHCNQPLVPGSHNGFVTAVQTPLQDNDPRSAFLDFVCAAQSSTTDNITNDTLSDAIAVVTCSITPTEQTPSYCGRDEDSCPTVPLDSSTDTIASLKSTGTTVTTSVHPGPTPSPRASSINDSPFPVLSHDISLTGKFTRRPSFRDRINSAGSCTSSLASNDPSTQLLLSLRDNLKRGKPTPSPRSSTRVDADCPSQIAAEVNGVDDEGDEDNSDDEDDVDDEASNVDSAPGM